MAEDESMLANLKRYPQLQQWFEANNVVAASTEDTQFILAVCLLLGNEEPAYVADAWLNLVRILEQSTSKSTFASMENVLTSFDLNFTDVIEEVALAAIESREIIGKIMAPTRDLAHHLELTALQVFVAWLEFRCGLFQESIDRCEDIDPNSFTLTLQARCYQSLKRWHEALTCLNAAKTLAPTDKVIWLLLSDVYFNLKEYKNSWECLNKCATLYPSDSDVADKLASIKHLV
jgi:tetratricopeptide (TPR) repeat protein